MRNIIEIYPLQFYTLHYKNETNMFPYKTDEILAFIKKVLKRKTEEFIF